LGSVENLGWPCYEGAGRQPGYDGANLSVCENLYGASGAVTAPYYAYNHSSQVVPNETCPSGGSSISGLEFAAAQNTYPAEYDGALFFADYSRDCIWAMLEGGDGQPAPGLIRTFVAPASNPVHLETGPDGDLFYVDFGGGTIRRIEYVSTNRAPTAVAQATPTTGSAPLTVAFDGTESSDPDLDTLTYAWDLDGDGAFDDSTAAQPTFTYTSQGSYTATLRVTDPDGASDTDSVTITVGNTPPTATITTPTADTTWKVGDTINFSGSAADQQDGPLPPSALTWSLVLQHCPSNCHAHPIQDFVGVSSGSFVAPDHQYPSYLELWLTATDSGGRTDTEVVRLDPQTVTLTFQTIPGGLELTVNGVLTKATFSRTVIVGSANTVSAPDPQNKGKKSYNFQSWSDGGAQTHNIVAPATATTYTARFR
jgi:PKD repeat protein